MDLLVSWGMVETNESLELLNLNQIDQLSFENSDYLPKLENPPHKGLKVSVVIPLYKEFENGNLERIVDAFCKQSDVDSTDFELIFILNNRSEDYDSKNDTYKDNMQSKHFIEMLGQEDAQLTTEGLSEYQKKVLDRARSKKITVNLIDFSQGIERNMALIRNQGTNEAIFRFESGTDKKDKGIIVQLDADSFPANDFIKQIILQFSERNLDALFAGYESMAV